MSEVIKLNPEKEKELDELTTKKRLEALSIKYGANQIYAVEKLPMPGWIYEYKDQTVIASDVKNGVMQTVMISNIKSKDNKLTVKAYDRGSKEVVFEVDVLGAGKEESTGNEIRLFPPSYAQFISETTIFHRNTLKNAWEKCKQISKLDFKSYSSDSGNALLNSTDNVGMLVKVKEDDYLYIRITKVVWNSKEKTFSIFHGTEEMKFHSFPEHEFKFEKEDNEFTNIQFKMTGLMNNYSPIFKFDDLRCKVIDLKDLSN